MLTIGCEIWKSEWLKRKQTEWVPTVPMSGREAVPGTSEGAEDVEDRGCQGIPDSLQEICPLWDESSDQVHDKVPNTHQLQAPLKEATEQCV